MGSTLSPLLPRCPGHRAFSEPRGMGRAWIMAMTPSWPCRGLSSQSQGQATRSPQHAPLMGKERSGKQPPMHQAAHRFCPTDQPPPPRCTGLLQKGLPANGCQEAFSSGCGLDLQACFPLTQPCAGAGRTRAPASSCPFPGEDTGDPQQDPVQQPRAPELTCCFLICPHPPRRPAPRPAHNSAGRSGLTWSSDSPGGNAGRARGILWKEHTVSHRDAPGVSAGTPQGWKRVWLPCSSGTHPLALRDPKLKSHMEDGDRCGLAAGCSPRGRDPREPWRLLLCP